AFDALKSRFYLQETIQRDPPKGNFSNVARHRPSGVLLGPTNYHSYQPTLRKLYEERFSRRMSFQDFLRDVETVSDPGLVEQWKEQVRTTTVYKSVSPAQTENTAPPDEGITSAEKTEPNEESAQPPPTDGATSGAEPQPATE